MKNNLISLLDRTFPDVNKLFTSPPQADGHEKWINFAKKFRHCECICSLSQNEFAKRYHKWCKRNGYNYSAEKAFELYADACGHVSVLPRTDSVKALVTTAISQLLSICETLASIKTEMTALAKQLPEYDTVISMYGVGETIAPQLIAEIGEVSRFRKASSLVAFDGVDAPPYQSGTVDIKSRKISKRGSAPLRRVLFQIASCHVLNSPVDKPIYNFIDKKHAEGKHYLCYMIAACNKFLRIYYAKVNAVLS